MNRKEFLAISKEAFHKWQANNATLRAAALAFFTILPLPSLLLITIEIFSLVYGQAQALQQLIQQINNVAGPTVADLVSQLLRSTTNPFTSVLGSIISVAFAVAGAVGAFVVLQDTMNAIWDVTPNKHRSLKMKVRERIVPFLLFSSTAFIVVAWTGLTAVLYVSISFLLGSQASLVLGAAQILLSFALTVLLFAIIYKQIPDIKIEWRDVALAAVITSVVSTAANYLFSVYIRVFSATSLAGTAGSIMVLMLWIFLTDEFILFGAQFSRTYAETSGSISEKTMMIRRERSRRKLLQQQSAK